MAFCRYGRLEPPITRIDGGTPFIIDMLYPLLELLLRDGAAGISCEGNKEMESSAAEGKKLMRL